MLSSVLLRNTMLLVFPCTILILIGKTLILSPSFPPAHTVHATFTAHGVPSVQKLHGLVTIPPFPLQKLHWFDHYFSASSNLLIVLRQNRRTLRTIPFLVPMDVSFHMYLGACFACLSTDVPAGKNPFAHHRCSHVDNYLPINKQTFLRRFVSWCSNILTLYIL